MISLKWGILEQADAVSFKIYRSFIGFAFESSAGSIGKTITLKMNGGPLQTITIGSDLIASINATMVGGRAYLSHGGGGVIVRSDLRDAPGSIQITGGTLGLLNRTITAKSEDIMVSVVTVANVASYEYMDMDGAIQDYYRISVINTAGDESKKTDYRQPTQETGAICVVEGLITDVQGVRLVDVNISATIEIPPESLKGTLVSRDPVSVSTGTDGRFSLPLLQGSTVRLEIISMNVSKVVKIPARPYIMIMDLLADTDHDFDDRAV